MSEEQFNKQNGNIPEESSPQNEPTPAAPPAKSAKRPAKSAKRPAKSTNGAKKKKPKKKRRSNGAFTQFLAVFIVFLAFYLVISLFIVGLIYYSFNDTAKTTELYSINVIYDEQSLYKVDAQSANNEYGLYLPFNYLSEIGSFGLAGNGDDATLFIIGTDNRIECTKNSSLVIINGNPVRISAPIIYEENEYYIPVSLIENYINGIDVSYDDEEMVCSISSDLGKSDIALKLRLPEAHKLPDYFTHEDMYYPDQSQNSD